MPQHLLQQVLVYIIGNMMIGANNTEYVTWTFRKEPKFFDIQTEDRTISHNLGSVPGMIIVKLISHEDWCIIEV